MHRGWMWPGSSCSKGRFLHEATTSNPQATGQASGKQPSRLMNSLLRMVSKIILGFRCLHLLGLCRFGVGFRLFTVTQVPAEKIKSFGVRPFSPSHCRWLKSHAGTGGSPKTNAEAVQHVQLWSREHRGNQESGFSGSSEGLKKRGQPSHYV